MPAASTTLPQRTISDFTKLCISATGLVSIGNRLSLVTCALTSGLARMALNSGMVLTGIDGLTIRTNGLCATSANGTSSVVGSNDRFLYRDTLIAIGVDVAISSV